MSANGALTFLPHPYDTCFTLEAISWAVTLFHMLREKYFMIQSDKKPLFYSSS